MIDENEQIRNNLNTEYRNLNNLIAKISRNQKKYAAEIKSKQKQSKEIDKKISRTRHRPVASGEVSTKAAFGFLMILFCMSFCIPCFIDFWSNLGRFWEDCGLQVGAKLGPKATKTRCQN